MNEISPFDQIGRLQLRAVGRDDTDTECLRKQLPLSQMQLYEVWVVPEKGQCFTSADVQEMHIRELRKVIDIYDPELSDAPLHAMSKQIDLLETFAINLTIGEARFEYAILPLAIGPVLSIVFGSRKAMSHTYTKAMRKQIEMIENSD